MKKLHLDIAIEAPQEKVWNAIVTEAKYREWTSVFQAGSTFEGGWNKGDKILFIAFNDQGQKEGMVSEIAESNFPEYISVRHLGYLLNGYEDTTSPAIKEWAPSYENYTLEKIDALNTRFVLDMDVTEDYFDMFMDLWPKAMQKLKEVSELAA
jgi:hypothetical protein